MIRNLKAELLGRPRAWPRTALSHTPGGKVRQVNPAGYRRWKAEAADKLQAFASYRSFPGEVSVTIDVGPDRVRVSVAALDETDPRRAPTKLTGDLDNYAKAVLDALQASRVIADDRDVVELVVRFRP